MMDFIVEGSDFIMKTWNYTFDFQSSIFPFFNFMFLWSF